MLISVPGNLLLLGEYAVLEEGGLGIALAVEPRVQVHITRSQRLEIRGHVPGQEFLWNEDQPEQGLFECCVAACRTLLAEMGRQQQGFPLTIDVNSGSFYTGTGDKLGFGSSAAVAVGVCGALLGSVLDQGPPLLQATGQAALLAHRRFQGGRGSGYDVLTSLLGGMGLFRGGIVPTYASFRTRWSDEFLLLRGGGPVSTPGAVTRYQVWTQDHAQAAHRFLAINQRLCELFRNAPDARVAGRILQRAAALGRWLGEQLDCPSEPPALGTVLRRVRDLGAAAKACGAGGEIGIAFFPQKKYTVPEQIPGVEALTPAHEGIRWAP